jgi:transglutaminase-like putative cysteine protease
VIYDVLQVTTFRYTAPVTSARHVLRLRPADGPGQRVVAHALTLEPAASARRQAVDFFGNATEFVDLDTVHRELVVRARSRVTVQRRASLLGLVAGPWGEVAEAALAEPSLRASAPAHFLFPTGLTRADDALRAYALHSFLPGRPMDAAARELCQRLKRDMAYAPGSTHVRTTALEAFQQKRGVCQDLAHVMIAGLRALGLPAAYVSGYLRTLPPPGKPRLQGADATHAWVDVWCGPQVGWLAYDPTNGIAVGDDHIVLATGRDYADVAPIDGIVVTSGGQDIDVKVDVLAVG